MKYVMLIWIVVSVFSYSSHAQSETRISSIDFVQVQNDNYEEAFYYYENNWRWLRELAVEKGYIADFEYFKVERTPETPYDLILITIYQNQNQADSREANFAELIEMKGSLRLLNDKQPGDFRKLLSGHNEAYHLPKRD